MSEDNLREHKIIRASTRTGMSEPPLMAFLDENAESNSKKLLDNMKTKLFIKKPATK